MDAGHVSNEWAWSGGIALDYGPTADRRARLAGRDGWPRVALLARAGQRRGGRFVRPGLDGANEGLAQRDQRSAEAPRDGADRRGESGSPPSRVPRWQPPRPRRPEGAAPKG